MDETCYLSILIVSLEKRKHSLDRLTRKLEIQIENVRVNNNFNVSYTEILVNSDNGEKKIGTKRNELLCMSKGLFFTFIDDDDDVDDFYIYRIMLAIRQSNFTIDVFSFQQLCSLDNGKTTFFVNADIKNVIDEHIPLHTTRHKSVYQRNVWHWCVFNSKFKHVLFKDMQDGEDYDWLLRIRPLLKKQCHLNLPLYLYTTSPETSECSYFNTNVTQN